MRNDVIVAKILNYYRKDSKILKQRELAKNILEKENNIRNQKRTGDALSCKGIISIEKENEFE